MADGCRAQLKTAHGTSGLEVVGGTARRRRDVANASARSGHPSCRGAQQQARVPRVVPKAPPQEAETEREEMEIAAPIRCTRPRLRERRSAAAATTRTSPTARPTAPTASTPTTAIWTGTTSQPRTLPRPLGRTRPPLLPRGRRRPAAARPAPAGQRRGHRPCPPAPKKRPIELREAPVPRSPPPPPSKKGGGEDLSALLDTALREGEAWKEKAGRLEETLERVRSERGAAARRCVGEMPPYGGRDACSASRLAPRFFVGGFPVGLGCSLKAPCRCGSRRSAAAKLSVVTRLTPQTT